MPEPIIPEGLLASNSDILCYVCKDRNLTPLTDEIRISCPKCQRPYCPTHASKVDQSYCENCLSDFVVEEKTFTKVEEDFVVKTQEFITRKSSCRQIILKGTDWLFYQHAIEKMSDAELALSLRWHKAAVSLVEHEVTNRKIEASKKLQGVKVTIRKEVKETKTTRTKRKIDLSPEGMKAIAAALAKLNVTPEQLASIQQQMEEKKRQGDMV